MILTNIESIPGKRIVEHFGVVSGSTVRAKHVGRDFMASLKNIVGGELKGYTELLQDSRKQEAMADRYALDLMNRRYGQVSGAIEFMQKITAKEERGHLAYYFSTHPHPEKRLADIKSEIRKKGYTIRMKRDNKTIN